MKKIWIAVLVIFNILAVFYLVSPTPKLGDLTTSVKSNEPGDTVQLANVDGYYTNLSRTEVMNFYLANYGGLIRLRINHPPERARVIFRDTMKSYYLEEMVLPFKESLYINGFEWENDVFTKPEKRIKNQLSYEGKIYKAKINTRVFPVPVQIRLLNFGLIEIGIGLIIYLYMQFWRKNNV